MRARGGWRRLRYRLRRFVRRRILRLPDPEPESAARPAGEEAPEYHSGRDALKDWYTSHWDLDMLPREEMERLAREARAQQGAGEAQQKDAQSPTHPGGSGDASRR